jgi:uncharacterized protein YjeT (DUF2065 family)
MKVIVYLLGFGHIAVSSFLILYARETVGTVKGWFQTYQLKYLSALPVVVGVLFLISASATTHPWVFRILALLAFCEAVVAFTNPQKIYSRMLDWYFENVSDQTNRLFGVIGIIFGTVILTWI